jgi:hypothetical protein
VGLAAAEDLPEDGLGKNFLKIGLPAIIAGLGTMGLAALPMAVAFGLGSASEETKQQRNRRRDAFKDVADEDYALAKDELEMTQEILGVGGNNQTPARVRALQMLTQGMPEEEQRKAYRIELGLDGRQMQSGFRHSSIVGSDGRSRHALTSATGQILMDDGQGNFRNYGLQHGERLLVPNEQTGQMEDWTQRTQPTAGFQPSGAPQAPQQEGSSAQGQIAAPGPSPAQNPAIPGRSQVNPLVGRPTEQEAGAVEAARLAAQSSVRVPSQDWRWNGVGEQELIPGSKAHMEWQDARRKAVQANISVARKAETVLSDIQGLVAPRTTEDGRRLPALVDDMMFGRVAAVQEALPPYLQSDAYRDTKARIASLKGSVGIEQLLDIKSSGAGLGHVPQTQLQMLSDLLGSLETAQSKEQFVEILQRIHDTYMEIAELAAEELEGPLGMPDRVPGRYQRFRESGALEPTRRHGGGGPGTISVDPSMLNPAARRALGLEE